jgi:DNA replication and repair protein RecF
VRVDQFRSTHFRNLADGTLEFGPGLNLLIGANGQGKTNLLEAVYYFRFGRSFRAQNDADLIRFGEPFCRVEAACTFADGRVEAFAFAVERRQNADAVHVTRTIKIDGQLLARRSDLAGRFPAVLFGPGDLRVVAGEPEHRRRFFDMIGVMTDPGYLRAAGEYRRALEQRNAALKARATRDEMAAWNDRLVAAGVDLIARRRDLVGRMEAQMVAHARELESPFDFSMRYDSALLDAAAGGAEAVADAALREAFHARLASVAYDELRRGVTLVGPHRDDVGMSMAGVDLRRFGSQGQRRLLAVLLKLSELSHLEAELREPCVLLLDDVFSEFDGAIMGKLQRLLDGERQVFVTTPVPLAGGRAARARTYRVDAGQVSAA